MLVWKQKENSVFYIVKSMQNIRKHVMQNIKVNNIKDKSTKLIYCQSTSSIHAMQRNRFCCAFMQCYFAQLLTFLTTA